MVEARKMPVVDMESRSMNLTAALMRLLSIGLLLALAGTAVGQQAYPNKPIRFIIPFAPGSSADPVVRFVGRKLSENWSQPVIVDNRPGGNSIIGSEELVKSAPDGYTILQTSVVHVTTPFLLPTPYDAIKDFAPVATLIKSEFVLVLNPSMPVSNLQQFIVLAKSKPGQLNFASAGSGTGTHLAGEMFNLVAGVKMQHIPYKGSAPAITDLIGGQVQLSFQTPIAVISHINSGKLKAIAISGETRFATLPQIPTFTEAGLPGFDARIWFGVLAPAGTRAEIINKLSVEIAKILALPDFRDSMISQGMEPFVSTPSQFAALIKADMAKYGNIIKTAKIKAD